MKSKRETEAVDSELIRRLYYFFKPYRWWALFAIFLTLSASYLGTIRPKLTQIAVDDHIAIGDVDGLLWIITLLVLALVGEFVVLIINTYVTRWFGQGVLFRIRNAVFEKIQSLHVQFFDKNPIGRLITRTTSDIEALSELLSDGIVNMIGDLFRIFFILYFMLSMSWELTVVSVLVLPMLFYATFWFKGKVRIAYLEVRDQIARLNSFVQEHINGMSVVQLFNREKKEKEKFVDINADHRKAHIKTIFYFSIFWPLVEVFASLAMALVVWYGGGRALMGDVTFGVLLAFIQYVRQFFNPIRGLSEKYNTLQSALASSERIFNVLDTPKKVLESSEGKSLKNPKGKIEFQNVSFRYNADEELIINDVSFDVEPGELLAVVGATGAGKTTLINLLLRFYDIQEGKILLDGTNIKDVSLKNLRSQFALVLQDNALFSGTVLENITLGHEEITREQVIEAAKEVEAHQFIKKLPGTYDFVLQERGASLSMGQRQLICFVRAMVYDPKILILDEATSSVDSETEELVSLACKKMMQGRTSIVIAHRLSTIQGADKILVMHKGQIRECGNHRELIQKEGGIYRKLYELQYRDQAINSKSIA
ncbi:ABC transporter ATP-binding protein [Rhodohalobacter sulfatireducens]|uniref:ABC transporter ATP-binding protein/permease n=1 Tax=Rhodohalobacter sulfatireducens TaxID=2911366 RepID=A0ABS9KB58_9BACT|nr:ABC transporter ATP-binding protein [Rhodohalobacter sulfatireducens]MCG2588086.1 ABC transporter ATP-binding protein/permease [Rhodohalobacter sulfatireducens]